jgi:hypothetical protein
MICTNKDHTLKARRKSLYAFIESMGVEKRLEERDLLQEIRNKQRESNWAKKMEAL